MKTLLLKKIFCFPDAQAAKLEIQNIYRVAYVFWSIWVKRSDDLTQKGTVSCWNTKYPQGMNLFWISELWHNLPRTFLCESMSLALNATVVFLAIGQAKVKLNHSDQVDWRVVNKASMSKAYLQRFLKLQKRGKVIVVFECVYMQSLKGSPTRYSLLKITSIIPKLKMQHMWGYILTQ